MVFNFSFWINLDLNIPNNEDIKDSKKIDKHVEKSDKVGHSEKKHMNIIFERNTELRESILYIYKALFLRLRSSL